MTALLEIAIERIRELPADLQDEMARLLIEMADEGQGVYVLTPEEEASLEQGLRQAERGEFATEEEVQALWAKYRL